MNMLNMWFALLTMVSLAVCVSSLRCWTCENAKSPKHCIKSGQTKQCRFTEDTCQTEVRKSEGYKTLIKTGCKEGHACGNNQIQNPRSAWFPTQCNGNNRNSVCRCCCQSNNCNRRNLLCNPTQPKALESITKRPRNPVRPSETITTTTTTEKPIARDVDISPPSSSTEEAKSDQPKPSSPERLIEPVCENLPVTPNNGERICSSDLGELGTECLFSCNDGYKLNGTLSTVCEYQKKQISWTHESPTCVPELPVCPNLGSFSHGEMTCTDVSNTEGTICTFRCLDEGYELGPSDAISTECITDGASTKWSHRKPCCSSQCPGMAKKDVVIVMDSSSSISKSEWQTMKEFVANVTGKFKVSSEGVQFAVYRFFRRVDTKHQVHFGDFENDNEGLREAVLNLPKQGGGTYIGKALRHARDNVLTKGNRDDVKDLAWILTDGRSDDDTEEISRELRDAGVEIMALGISRRGKDVFKDELVRIAGDKVNVLEVTRGMKSLTEDLVDRMVRKICETSCEI